MKGDRMSPRRRHILASMNFGDDRSLPPRPAPEQSEDADTTSAPRPSSPVKVNDRSRSPARSKHEDGDDLDLPASSDAERRDRKRTTKFRFKSSKSKSSSRRHDRDEESQHHRRRRRERDDEEMRTGSLEDIGEDTKSRRHRPESPYSSTRHRHRSSQRYRDGEDGEQNGDADTDSRRHKRRRHRDDGDHDDGDDEDPDRRRRHRRRHRHHHHHHRKERSPTPPNPYEEPPLDPDAAFRESLFDAMADEEGADYWAAVYGQPVNIYPYPGGDHGDGGGAANGGRLGEGDNNNIHRMTDDDYAAYVRQRMWEKTHEGLLEERARREAARRRKEDERQEARRLTRELEDSLRRGEERRQRKVAGGRWRSYREAWDRWDGDPGSIPWPEGRGGGEEGGGGTASIDVAAVRDFFVTGIDARGVGEAEFRARIKDERVRWHPDRVQQRAGGRDAVPDAVMRDVTAVFQVVDKLWSEARSSGGGGTAKSSS